MSVKTERWRKILVPADLDEGAQEGFFAELEIVLEDSPPEAVLDCALLDHATSGHINMLWEAQTKCEEAGTPMRLKSVRYGLERVLRILDLYDLFTLEPKRFDESDAADSGSDTAEAPVLDIEFKATMNGISDALSTFHDFLVRSGLPGSCAFDLEIVFYEVATNIRRHSGLDEADHVEFTATVEGNSVLLRFADAGEPFDPTRRSPVFDARVAIRTKQTNGIGLTMIQRLVDTISYKRVDGRLNVVTLTKQINRRG
jgi:anti-sigma regulatory factor (Ser/Thr protein kinase)/anti-anti-sigma regulatory factor